MSFIDKNAEFQTNQFMNIKYVQHLLNLETGGGGAGTLKRQPYVILQTL